MEKKTEKNKKKKRRTSIEYHNTLVQLLNETIKFCLINLIRFVDWELQDKLQLFFAFFKNFIVRLNGLIRR